MFTKKIKFLLGCTLCIILQPSVFAGAEEDACFTLLHDAIKTDTRFGLSSGLSGVDIANGTRGNLDTYAQFEKYREKNHNWDSLSASEKNQRSSKGVGKQDFLARRTTIAPVIVPHTSVITQIVGFGKLSNFVFPLPAETGEVPYGDAWTIGDEGIFKEYVLYTQHSIENKLLSCGLFHITPLNNRKLDEIPESQYLTNITQGKERQSKLGGEKCMSGFKGQDTEKDGEKFYKMYSNVCTLDYEGNDFIRMEVLAFAYDNKSSYFNEYVVFPLQVESMTTDVNANQTLNNVRDVFDDKLKNKTCLRIISDTNGLPPVCRGNNHGNRLSSVVPEHSFGTPRQSFGDALFAFLFPSASAAREFNFSQEDIENASGLISSVGLPYDLYEKLNSIPNKNFQEYIKIALTPGYEHYMRYRKENGVAISAFEDTFLSCNISYQERLDVFADLLEKIDVNTFDIANISYSNPKVGDCIIPYPDVTHRATEIEGSFDDNKLLASIVNGTYESAPPDADILAMVEEKHAAQIEFETAKDRITQLFEEGQINHDTFEQQVGQAQEIFDNKMIEIQNIYDAKRLENNKKLTRSNDTQNTVTSSDVGQKPMQTYIIIAIVAILGVLFLSFALRTKNKK